MSLPDFDAIEARRVKAAGDKSDLFDFYHANWEMLVAELKKVAASEVSEGAMRWVGSAYGAMLIAQDLISRSVSFGVVAADDGFQFYAPESERQLLRDFTWVQPEFHIMDLQTSLTTDLNDRTVTMRIDKAAEFTLPVKDVETLSLHLWQKVLRIREHDGQESNAQVREKSGQGTHPGQSNHPVAHQ